jgi:hypothetical protein
LDNDDLNIKLLTLREKGNWFKGEKPLITSILVMGDGKISLCGIGLTRLMLFVSSKNAQRFPGYTRL